MTNAVIEVVTQPSFVASVQWPFALMVIGVAFAAAWFLRAIL